jgi:hypothetical protein
VRKLRRAFGEGVYELQGLGKAAFLIKNKRVGILKGTAVKTGGERIGVDGKARRRNFPPEALGQAVVAPSRKTELPAPSA